MKTYKQRQKYGPDHYSVSRLLDISKNIKVENVDIRTMSQYYEILPEDYDISDVVNTINRVLKADLKYPLLIYRGFIMDGKHRLTKALLQKKKTIKVKFLKELPVPDN